MRSALHGCRFIFALILLAWMAGPAKASPRHPNIVLAIAEDEYHAKETLPEFAKSELEGRLGFHCTILQSDSKTDLQGTEALKNADLLIMFMRRRTLPKAQLKAFQDYFNSGRPVVALRTSCHAFQNWLDFDKIVLGCNYNNHYKPRGTLKVEQSPGVSDQPTLTGIPKTFSSTSSLYKVLPLAPTCQVLLTGTWEDKPPEPVAWTNHYKGGRIFFTSLGDPDDFHQPAFRTLLTNGVLWALGRDTK